MMSDFKINEVLVIKNTSVKLQRLNWEQLKCFLIKKVTEYGEATSNIDILIRSTLFQNLAKVSNHVQKLAQNGKAMNSNSTIKFTPAEKNGLKFIIDEQYNYLSGLPTEETTYFFAYLQPILDKFQQFEINNQGLTIT